ncbi:MAG: hypothetical protein K5666_02095 [Bacilli bacterium]|nr:hypothetical protein [Bacilli bacterium]
MKKYIFALLVLMVPFFASAADCATQINNSLSNVDSKMTGIKNRIDACIGSGGSVSCNDIKKDFSTLMDDSYKVYYSCKSEVTLGDVISTYKTKLDSYVSQYNDTYGKKYSKYTPASESCYSNIATYRGKVSTTFGNLYGCQQSHSCTNERLSELYTTFESDVIDGYKVANDCSTYTLGQNFKTDLTDWVSKYNGTFGKNFSPGSSQTTSECFRAISDQLTYLASAKKTIVDNGYSYASDGQSPPGVAWKSFKQQLDAAYVTYEGYLYSTCDMNSFYNTLEEYKAFYEEKSNQTYQTQYTQGCRSDVTKVSSYLNSKREEIDSNQCGASATVSHECLTAIRQYKEALKTAYSNFYQGTYETCATSTGIEDILRSHEVFYNNLPYVIASQELFDPKDVQQIIIHEDPVFCPLGDDVTQDLVGILRIFKIAAPILVLVYTAYETIKSLTAGDMQTEAKKLFKRFAKRCIAAVLLFAIPVIVDAVFQLLNVWDETGRCVFEDTQVTTKAAETCEQKCGHIGDETGRQVCLNNCTTTKSETCEQKCGHIGDETGRQVCLNNCPSTITAGEMIRSNDVSTTTMIHSNDVNTTTMIRSNEVNTSQTN